MTPAARAAGCALALALAVAAAPEAHAQAQPKEPPPTAAAAPAAANPFELRDGDRVVFLGNTVIEREAASGYWETALAARWPDRDITFRNLGWSGDTVFGHARSYFGPPAEGLQRLRKHLELVKPTVLLVCYGAVAAFEGEAGLTHFVAGHGRLLDDLEATGARIVLISPPPQEKLAPPLPDPAAHNRRLALYRDGIRDLAARRGHGFADFFAALGKGDPPAPAAPPLTDNGLHFLPHGYWRTAPLFQSALGVRPAGWLVEVDARLGQAVANGAQLERLSASGLGASFQVQDNALPPPPPPPDAPADFWRAAPPRTLRVLHLSPGDYTLTIGDRPVQTAPAHAWAAGVRLAAGPELEQAERLRRAVVTKNELFFHRWRPANETYLHGFRKHEQGNNAREMPLFDPLVEKAEETIADLRRPRPHRYVLAPAGE